MTIAVTDNIILELLDSWHASETFALIDSNRQYLREWLPWVDHMRTAADFKNYIQRTQQQAKDETDYGFVVKFNGKIAGRIGLHYIDRQNKTGALGYWLGESFAGNGIITKACAVLINFAFDKLQLNRVEIKCATGNTKSKAIAERLGFKQEGILKQAEFVNTHFIDLYLYSMLKTDWQQQG